MYEGKKKWELAPHPNGHPDLVFQENLTRQSLPIAIFY